MNHFTHYTQTGGRKVYLVYPTKWWIKNVDQAEREVRQYFKCKSDQIVSQAGWTEGDDLYLEGLHSGPSNAVAYFKV